MYLIVTDDTEPVYSKVQQTHVQVDNVGVGVGVGVLVSVIVGVGVGVLVSVRVGVGVRVDDKVGVGVIGVIGLPQSSLSQQGFDVQA